MAGKHIYIETILDNLLGGFQTAFDKMTTALNKMIGKTEEFDGTSMTDISEKLDTFTTKLDTQIGALNNVVSTLSQTVNPTNLVVTNEGELSKYLEIPNDALNINIVDINVKSGAVAEILNGINFNNVTKSYKLLCDGSLKIAIDNIRLFGIDTVPGNSHMPADKSGFSFKFQIQKNGTDVANVIIDEYFEVGYGVGKHEYSDIDQPYSYDINVAKDDVIKVVISLTKYTGYSSYISDDATQTLLCNIPENFIKIKYDFKNIMADGGIFEEVL